MTSGIISIRHAILVVACLFYVSSAVAQDNLAALEKNALSILDKHCSSCHQIGKTIGTYKERPAGNFGYVLSIDRLISNKFIKPGLPNASSLYIKMEKGEMPKGISDQCYAITPPAGVNCGPDAREIKVIFNWIEKLKSRQIQVERPFITNEAMIAAMVQDIATISEPKRTQIRYLVLTNLYNAGDQEKDLKGYRMALTKLVNSLSFESDPVKLVTVDKNKTILRVNIADLGWTAEKWNAIAKRNPYALEYNDINYAALKSATKTTQPFLRGDWFNHSASQPPLYYDILGLPKNKRDLEKMLGVDVQKNIQNLKVARAGFQNSGVSENNRLIERHTSRTGAYWESYDFAGNKGRQSFFKFPLGPIYKGDKTSKKYGFVHDGGEIIFELPNGFHGYYLTDEKGKRIKKGPQSIVTHSLRRDRAVTNGVSCMDCHNKGIKFNDNRPREKQDQVRAYVESTAELDVAARDIVKAIYPNHEDFYKLMVEDAKRYKVALNKVGVDINYSVNDLEVVNALFVRFEKDLDIRQAAAAFGLTEKQFEEEANKNGGAVFALKQRLKHGAVPRDQFVAEFVQVVSRITRDKPVVVAEVTEKKVETYENGKKVTKVVVVKKVSKKLINVVPKKGGKSFNLIFFPNQKTFIKGQPISFIVKSEKSCYLTLINIPEKGQSTVIFPNKFNQNNRIEAGIQYEIPGALVKNFTLRFAHSGEERVIAICNASRPDPLGIKHNFKNQSYTTFTNYDQVITRGFRDRKRVRQIIVEKTDREKKLPALVVNKKDKHIDIEARAAVLLHVKDH